MTGTARRPFLARKTRSLRRTLATAGLVLATAAGVVAVTPTQANAHGAATSPGSRTYLCYQDLILSEATQTPRNAGCASAVASGTTQPLYDWFGVLRSDGAGRMAGFIPDGELCGGGSAKFKAYNAPGTAWPATHLTSGAPWTVHYNAWAAHPGQFRLYVTKDGWDPSKPLAWSDLESTPFSTWDERTPNGDGEYYWDVTLPRKTGRHIIYSVWSRTDSTETFYGCSDVEFDGGRGNVTGIPGYDGDTGTPTTPVTTAPVTTAPVTTAPVTTGPATNASCTAKVTAASSWGGGYQGTIAVTNKGATVNNWSVTFTLPSGVTIQNGWNGTFSTSGSTVTVTAPTWSSSLAANAQTSIGFVANGPSNPLPSGVKLNGATCAA